MKFRIVDTTEDYDELYSLLDTDNESIWMFHWRDHQKHVKNNSLSFVSILVDEVLWVIGVEHIDLISFQYTKINELFQINSKKWVFDSKKIGHIFKLVNVEDIDTLYFIHTSFRIDYNEFNDKVYGHYIRLGYKGNLTEITPITVLIQNLRIFFDKYTSNLDKPLTDEYYWYKKTYIPVLRYLESHGLYVNEKKFIERFPQAKDQINDGKVWTEYHPYTITGRPSNTHSSVNYLALNKEDGTRDIFGSNGGVLAGLDYDAHHVRLIGKLVNYELPKTSAHQWLADQYGVGYDESKAVTFRLLYGGIDEEFLQIPFYKQTQEFIDTLWEQTVKNGFLKTKRRNIPLKWIKEPNPQKVFNYLLQAIELEKNVDILKQLILYINDKNLYLLLYMYDSVIIWGESKKYIEEHINNIQQIMGFPNFPTTISFGNTLGDI